MHKPESVQENKTQEIPVIRPNLVLTKKRNYCLVDLALRMTIEYK